MIFKQLQSYRCGIPFRRSRFKKVGEAGRTVTLCASIARPTASGLNWSGIIRVEPAKGSEMLRRTRQYGPAGAVEGCAQCVMGFLYSDLVMLLNYAT